jgi:hypothetical protein
MLANKSNAVCILTIAIFVWFSAVVYCKTNFYQDPGSAFFDEKRAFTRDYSTYREEQSVNFFKEASEYNSKAAESPSLCAIFMSVRRIGEQPLNVSTPLS